MNIDRMQHWEKVYETKNPDQVSWTQEKPIKSLEFIHGFNLDKSAKIIDIGGGDSKLVDFLLDEVFSPNFNMINCTTEDHVTPFDTTQNFLFCSFKPKES